MDTAQTSVPTEASDKLRLCVVPMTSTDRVEVNAATILAHLKSLENFKPDLVCFPENSLYFNFNSKLNPTHALTLTENFWRELATWCKQNQCFLHLGGIPLREESARGATTDVGTDVATDITTETSNQTSKVSNASVVIEPSGVVKVLYRKIHLFDVDVEGRVVRESDSFCAGSEPAILEVKGWRVGMTICYDLRFAELFTHYHKQKADLILVPSSFLVPTGRSHWQVLLRARAIETQSFVAAPAQMGVHRSQQNPALPERHTWGESLIVGPWGEILAASSSFDQAGPLEPLFCVLDKGLITKTRQQIPLLAHRRLSP
jgi:deaminated glutathione amidase